MNRHRAVWRRPGWAFALFALTLAAFVLAGLVTVSHRNNKALQAPASLPAIPGSNHPARYSV